jgi:putative protease
VHEGSEDAAGDVGLTTPRPLAVAPAPTLPVPAKPNALRRPGATWLLEEKERPGEYMPIEEDEHGSYILNSKDLRAIEYVAQLTAIGIDSLKIEGRTKSPYYVARTCQSYRQAIDDAVAGRPFDAQLIGQLDGLANRGYTAGFYDRHPDRDYQNYLRGSSESSRSLYVGDVIGYDADGLAEIDVKNRFSVGDRIEIIRPAGNLELVIDAMRNKDGEAVSVAPGSGHRMRIALPAGCEGAFVARYV